MAKKIAGFGKHRHNDDDDDNFDENENHSIVEKFGTTHPLILAFDDVITDKFKPSDSPTEADELISTQDIFLRLQSHFKAKDITLPIIVSLLREHNYSSTTIGNAQLWMFSNR